MDTTPEAPYGVKTDGTPRRKPGRQPVRAKTVARRRPGSRPAPAREDFLAQMVGKFDAEIARLQEARDALEKLADTYTGKSFRLPR